MKKDPCHSGYVSSIFVQKQKSAKREHETIRRFEAAKKRREKVVTEFERKKSLSSSEAMQNENVEGPINKEPFLIMSSQEKVEEAIEQIPGPSNEQATSLPYLEEIDNLRREQDHAIEKLQGQGHLFSSFETLATKPKKFKYYTGIEAEKFEAIFSFVEEFLSKKSKAKLPYKDQLLMTLTKLLL